MCKKRAMRYLVAAVLTVLMAAALFACGGQGSTEETTKEPAATTSPTGTEAGSDAETQPPETEEIEEETEPPAPEMGSRIDLVAHTLTTKEDEVLLKLSAELVEAGISGNVTLTLSDEAGVIAVARFAAAGETTLAIACPADRIMGALTIRGSVTSDEGEVLDELELKLNQGLPQLTPDGVRCVVAAMTAEEKAHMITGAQDLNKVGASGGTYAIERLGVPSITVNDGPAGVRYGTSVWYPSVHNLAASWDPALIASVGESIGEDALDLGIDIVLGPGMNIQKNVLCGRNFEYCSEDPLLTGYVSAAYVKGMQTTGAGACLKHYAVNNQESARGSVSANVTERALREIYLKAFGIVVAEADPLTVMSSYNALNGVHTSVSRDLLTDILRGEFGFDGFVMSDWGAAGTITDKVNAGNDVNMPGVAGDPAELLASYKAGRVSDEALDACCYHVLTVVAQSATYRGLEMNRRLDQKGHTVLSANAAADTIILLQNRESALPLAKDTAVAVFGNGAFKTVFGGAGSGGVTPTNTVSIIDGIRRTDGLSVYDFSNNPFAGCAAHDALDASKDVVVTEAYAKEMAEGADVALIVISRGSAEGEDRSIIKGDFLLNDTERDMIERVSAAFRAKGKKVIVALNMGSPMEVVSWRELVDAILYVGYAGQGTGTALGRVLTGEVNPSAKTAITWPTTYESTPAAEYYPGSASDVTYYEDIYVGYRYYSTFGVDVAYPFGYGLSYTTFAYENFTVQTRADGTIVAKVTVTNTGSVAGREVVQLYVTKPETLQEQASLELAAFGKTKLLAPGESETLKLYVTLDALMTYDTKDSRWILDQGTYTLSVGASVAQIAAQAQIRRESVITVSDVENRCEPDTTFPYIQKESYKVPDASAARENLALNKPTATNYEESKTLTSDRAVDGAATTRWSGLGLSSGNHYWQVDLGKVYEIGEVKIRWESIHVPFTVLLSNDGKTFTEYKMYAPSEDMVSLINLYGAKARFIRLDIARGQAVSIFEFSAYEATAEDLAAGEQAAARVNLAKGKPVTATTCEGSYRKENAVDGDSTTRWGSLPTGEAWLQVDLTKVCRIDGLELWLESAWVPYRIEYSVDGVHYEILRTCQKDEIMVVLEDLELEARYIRLWRDGENWFSIYEIVLYGEEK